MSTMKAVRIHSYGGPEVLVYEDAPRPTPGPGEVLIKVKATAVNPIDWKIRAGHYKGMSPVSFPFILGWDLSGVVESVGSGVKQFKGGEEVFAYLNTQKPGAYADYVSVEEGTPVLKPKSLDPIHAAAIPLAGLTAYHGLFEEGQLKSGQRVLIHGAAGGVGAFAVQLAKWKGAYVIGTASGKNESFLRGLGVDEFIDYTKRSFDQIVRDVDLVFDTIGGETQEKSYGVLKKDGTLVSTVGIQSPGKAAASHISAKAFRNHINPAALKELGDLAVAGKLKVVVEKVFPLSEARAAHELSEAGHVRGKIVMEP
jgi:NADPH:quinone reductase-like Zn-dependent oxidoreductase